MKKYIVLILIMALSLCLFACGTTKDYDSCEFDYFFGEDFSWSMTMETAMTYLDEDEIEINEKTDYTLISDEEFIFRFGENDNLEFVKIRVNDTSMLDILVEEFGEYQEESDDNYYWYGTLNGEKTSMVLFISYTTDQVLLEFYPE